MNFQSRIRKLASETAVYGVSSIVGRMVNFLLFPFYSQVFPPDILAPIFVVYAAFQFLNILYQHGMESSYLKYAADADLDAIPSVSASETALTGPRQRTHGSSASVRRKQTYTTAMVSLVVVSAGLSLILVLTRGATGSLIGLESSHHDLLYLAAGILVLDSLAVVPFADLRLRNRPWTFAIIRFTNILVNVGLNLFLILILDVGIEAILIANLIASGVSLLLLSPGILKQLGGGVDPQLWKRLLAFGLPFIPGGLGYAMIERLNLFFLEQIPPNRVLELYGTDVGGADLARRAAEHGPAVYTEYVVGAYAGIIKLAVLMALVVQMFRYAWQPFFLQHQRDEDAPSLYSRVFSIFTAALLAVFLGVSFFAAEIVAFPIPGVGPLIAPEYWLGLPIIPLVLAGYVFQGWYYHLSVAAYLSNSTRYFVHATLAGGAVAAILNILFVPTFGMIAAAGATAVSYVVMMVTLYLLTAPRYSIPIQWKRVGATCLLAASIFLAWTYVPELAVWWAEILLIGFFVIVTSIILKRTVGM